MTVAVDIALWVVVGLTLGICLAILFARWVFRELGKQWARGVSQIVHGDDEHNEEDQ